MIMSILKVFLNIITAFIPVSSWKKRFRHWYKKFFNNRVTERYELAYKTYLVKQFVDPNKIPPMVGDFRAHQMELLEMLKAITKIFDKNGIVYWLDYGTLLGAVRHGGFIPWDDDMDIKIMDCDLKKLKKVMKQLPKKMRYRTFPFKTNAARVWKDKVMTRIFIDIYFAFNVNKMSKNDVDFVCKEYKKARRFNLSLIDGFFKINRKILSPYLRSNLDKKSEIFYTPICDYKPGKPPVILDYSDIFPLKTLSFEGVKFFVPNNSDKVLKALYGNYNEMPDMLFGWVHNNKMLKKIPKFE